jgi:hypothetical protein
MPTQKLLLLLALVAVLGGSSVWYMQTQLSKPGSVGDSVIAVQERTPHEADVTEASAESESSPTSVKPNTALSGHSNPVVVVPTVTTIDGDVAAISAAADTTYDDSSLDADFSSEGANNMTDSYDF